MELAITTLIENQQDDKGELCYEHGLSLYIEFQGKKILFDTGQSGEFLKNAQRLNKSMKDVNYIIISHGHYDHSGGCPELLAHLKQAYLEKPLRNLSAGENAVKPIMYIGKEFFVPKYKRLPDGSYHFNGNPFSEALVQQTAGVELKQIETDITYITEKIILYKNFEKSNEYEMPNPKFYVKKEADCAKQDEDYVQDSFVDEIALGLVTSKGLVLVVGCSHVGIVNILATVTKRTGLPVYAVLGGTHLVEAGEERIQKTLEALEAFGVQQIAVSHCTGEAGIVATKDKFQEGFINNNTGKVYQV